MPESSSKSSPAKRSLTGIAGIVAIATLVSKVFGLVREQAIAAAFGVGPVVNAYAYAYIVPGFLLILLGGINGPFHSALVSVLSRRDRSEAAPLVEAVTTLVGSLLLVVAIALIFFAGFFIDLVAPGLSQTPEGVQVRSVAILQLRIMAPMAVLAGAIGIGFGTLNASDRYWLPSVSPLFSSLTVIVGLGGLVWYLGDDLLDPSAARLGGIVLAACTLLGAVWQWLMQLQAQWRSGMGSLRLNFNWRTPGVREVANVMAPATLSSGMLHINVYTDLFFASYIEGAAAAMKYANLIVLTPLGIISNALLVPMLPVLSRLTAPESRTDLKLRIRQGIVLSALTMLPLTAVFLSLSQPIVRLIYQRYAFDAAATDFVTPVLMVYGLGMFFYLGRDVLVRVFYALGDGATPFRISIANIFLNAVLDFFLVRALATPGLVLATIGVNITSMAMLLWILHRRLGGLPLLDWNGTIAALCGCSAIAAGASWGASQLWERVLGSEQWWLQALELGVCAGLAIALFGILVLQLRLPEMQILTARLSPILQRFSRRR
ncbi:integral membrane protein MviN [Rubidibacter lacunae KORDI 51-2]|uniref:Probable lipid II flippase MurJ n=1 Tax=Rubidibacter lacunae KORDI 51-2 TaxID=582515 RepID=U5DHM5_9CHRO|nr:murein biosynthesis integral membrane protein MurJ [Rubidibacter lacunae]ERN41126.1 integral membrane protein MviN [Rubidibacter lacunae KORDI 51-2]